MIKALIFDLNGIFIQSPKLSDRFAKDFNVPQEIFLPELIKIMEQARKPHAQKTFAFWEPVLKSWGLNLSEEEFWKYWFNAELPSGKMIDLANRLKAQGLKIFLLSNNFKERSEYYGHYPWLHTSVNKAYFSWQTGFVKPDVRAWQIVLKENGLSADEVLFFDDQDKNIKVAESVGIKSFKFIDAQITEKIIEESLR